MFRTIVRRFSCTPFLPKSFPSRPSVPECELSEAFIKGGGKGGQKINKTSSKVQLRHVPTNTIVSCQFSRSREANRKRARELLAAKVEELEKGSESRSAILAARKQKKARKKKLRAKKKYAEREEKLRIELDKEEEKSQQGKELD